MLEREFEGDKYRESIEIRIVYFEYDPSQEHSSIYLAHFTGAFYKKSASWKPFFASHC